MIDPRVSVLPEVVRKQWKGEGEFIDRTFIPTCEHLVSTDVLCAECQVPV